MDAKTYLQEHVALFSGVSETLLTALAVSSSIQSYKKGQTVLFQGMTVDALHVVVGGKVAVLAKLPGRGLAEVAQLGPGEVFGEASIFESGTSGAAIKAAEDNTTVLVVPQDAFRRLIADDEAFVARLKALIASRRPAKPQA